MSQSARMTACPRSWSHAARCTESVDLPTPPLEFATVIIMSACNTRFRTTCKQYVLAAGWSCSRMGDMLASPTPDRLTYGLTSRISCKLAYMTPRKQEILLTFRLAEASATACHEATSGSVPKTALPFSPFLPVPPPGAEGDGHQTRRSRIRSTKPSISAPPQNFGGRNEPEQTAVGAQLPTLRRRIGYRHAGMDAGGPIARRRFLHQRARGRLLILRLVAPCSTVGSLPRHRSPSSATASA